MVGAPPQLLAVRIRTASVRVKCLLFRILLLTQRLEEIIIISTRMPLKANKAVIFIDNLSLVYDSDVTDIPATRAITSAKRETRSI